MSGVHITMLISAGALLLLIGGILEQDMVEPGQGWM